MRAVFHWKRSFWRWAGSGVFIGFLFLGCQPAEPIRLGFVGGTSGRVADLGISGRDAAQLAVEQCNRNGGIDGRQVLLIIKNDQQDGDMARKAVRELIGEGVAAIIGPMTSDMGLAITPLLNENRLVAVSPTVTTQHLSGRDDYFFRVSATTREYAGRSARYHIHSGDLRRIVAAYDRGNRSFTENWLENFHTPFTAAGGEILATIGFNTAEGRTFLEIARELLAPVPDGVLIIANSMDSAVLCQQIRKLDPAIPISLADWGATERLLELGGRAVEGVTVVQTFDRGSPAPRYQAFRKAYLERYHREPGFPGVYAHEATQVVLAALRAQKKGRSLKEALLSLRQFEGLQDDFSFDEFGDVKRSNASISIVRNRKFVVLE
ncbi:ABC transporter substrate-binding protein [Desulfosarcina alkanivorans]|uniref:ABC transporter substrate-binding protein n=1 Tax=Desulfosarcina alkanivorans TaxID=571177 RepID=A0A5K7YP37_9BACT|nr:ABC transporter substrate-binding protein [Desulfosarcina alkanivorans]BBO68681.1 ABC transporter substrate-binding protein [Desulfosarcina alkanivorans]